MYERRKENNLFYIKAIPLIFKYIEYFILLLYYKSLAATDGNIVTINYSYDDD